MVRTVDGLGNLLNETVNGRRLTHSRDLLGRRVGRITPTGHASASYDSAGRRISLDEWIVGITDATAVAHETRALVRAGEVTKADALIPAETRYPLPERLRARIGASGQA